jgi:hypothetical protein
MEKQTFNMRRPEKNEVIEMHLETKKRRAQQIKYKLIKDLMDGKTVDLTISPALYEALNKEKMEFEQILALHPDQAQEAIKAATEDRALMEENKYWNSDGAKWATLGHIPPCVYYSRPVEYWNDPRIIKAFFNIFTKFRISTRPI